jgi:hypothetical protein
VRPARTALSIFVAFSLPLYLAHGRFSLHFVGSSLDSDEVCMPLVRWHFASRIVLPVLFCVFTSPTVHPRAAAGELAGRDHEGAVRVHGLRL